MSRFGSILLYLCVCFAACASGYKFLGISHTGIRSHHIFGSSLYKALAEKGHEVTVISSFPLKKPLKNYHDIALPAMKPIIENEIETLLESLNKSSVENFVHYHDLGIEMTEIVLSEPEVQKLMASNAKFDAVIVEVFLSDALFGLAEHFKAPLIGLGPFGATTWNTDMVGSPSPPSYVPHAMLPFSDHMSLLERMGNFAFYAFERIYFDYFYLPRQEAVFKKYFPNNKRSLQEVRKNTALTLLNQHVSLSFARPHNPNQIEVGGLQINRKASPLPADIEKFINESEHGVIYFSMGSNLRSKNLPLDRRNAILDALRGLKQRVLWKFEDPNLPNKPDNVFIRDWFPQDDILRHPKVKAFITHGGLLGTTESIYHGKPVVGIPIFGDQFLNMARAEKYGYGITLDYNKLDSVSFKKAIQEIIGNPKYTEKMRAMSARYRDQKEEPMERAIYWVEHVVKHKGAEYMHCAGLDLGFMQYHSLDVILIWEALFVAVIGLEIYLFVRLTRWFKSLIFGKPQQKVKRN